MNKCLLGLLAGFCTMAFGQNANSLDPTQIYNTANLVNNSTSPTTTTGTWQNIGLWNQGLPCWAPDGPVYCGPQPYFNNGTFNFSYGMTDVYQTLNIANALPKSGTGLRVNGFNFGFMAKNGNGWDDGRQDYLVAYVNFFGSDGKVAQSYNYGAYTNQKYDWTQFNFSETFATPYASKDLSTARYGFVGMDNNFWAGPYGPEIYNVSFSLKYSVDPCATNVFYNPTCPGYMDALAKLAPASTLTTDPISTASNNTIIEPTNTTAPVTAASTGSTGFVSSTNLITNTTVAPVSTVTATVTPSATQLTNVSRAIDGTSIGLSVIAKNQQREQAIAMQAAQTAIAQADQAAQQSQQEALNVAQTSGSNSGAVASNPANRQAATIQQQRQDTALTLNTSSAQQLSLFLPPNAVQQNTFKPVDSVKSSATATNQDLFANAVAATTQGTQSTVESQVANSLLPPPPHASTANIQSSSTLVQSSQFSLTTVQPALFMASESVANDSQKMLTDRSNPLFQALENRGLDMQTNALVQPGSTVNRNAQNNEIAGGVDISRIAQAPAGYSEYMNFVLRDAAFYAPKEVYKNQRNVDNVRALRSLSSDRLHQDMVDQQYRK